MSFTGARNLDRSIEKTNAWLPADLSRLVEPDGAVQPAAGSR